MLKLALTLLGRSVYGGVNGYAKIDLDGNKLWSYPCAECAWPKGGDAPDPRPVNGMS